MANKVFYALEMQQELNKIEGKAEKSYVDDNLSFINSSLEDITKYNLNTKDISFANAEIGLQAFLDAIEAVGGGVAIIPPAGEYILNDTLYIPDNVTIFAYGCIFKQSTACKDYMVKAKIQKKQIKTPKNVTTEVIESGGTLAVGSYSYKVSAVNALGETMPSFEIKATTTVANSSVKINWEAPYQDNTASPITGYKVYGRTTKAVNLLLAQVDADVLTFTDTGTDGTSVILPTTNTTFERQDSITIFGGEWDAQHRDYGRSVNGYWQTDDWAGHAFCLEHVDNIELKDVTVKNAAKWCIAIADFKNVIGEHLKFDTGSDGIHVLAPGGRVVLNDVSGVVGDDMIGISLVEWNEQAASEGDIDEVIVKDVNLQGAFSALRILGGTGTVLNRITIDNVTGNLSDQTATAGIYANNDQNQEGRAGTYVNNVTIRNIDLRWDDQPAKPIIHFAPSQVKNLLIENVNGYGEGRIIVKIAAGKFENVKIKDIKCKEGNSVHCVKIGDGSTLTIKDLTIDGISNINEMPYLDNTIGISVGTLTTIRRMLIKNIKLESGNKGGYMLNLTDGKINSLLISDVCCTNLTSLINELNTTIGVIMLSNSTFNGDYALYVEKGGFEFMADNVFATGGKTIYLNGYKATGIRVRKGGFFGGSVAGRAGAETFRSEDINFRCDIRMLGVGEGGRAYNTYNGTDVNNIDTGIVFYKSGKWKNLINGVEYTPS